MGKRPFFRLPFGYAMILGKEGEWSRCARTDRCGPETMSAADIERSDLKNIDRRRSMKKRIMAFFLAATMLLSFVPQAVLAAPDEETPAAEPAAVESEIAAPVETPATPDEQKPAATQEPDAAQKATGSLSCNGRFYREHGCAGTVRIRQRMDDLRACPKRTRPADGLSRV